MKLNYDEVNFLIKKTGKEIIEEWEQIIKWNSSDIRIEIEKIRSLENRFHELRMYKESLT